MFLVGKIIFIVVLIYYLFIILDNFRYLDVIFIKKWLFECMCIFRGNILYFMKFMICML